MRRLRRIHLLIGSFAAPFCIFFSITGVMQTFGYHRGLKDGSYIPPATVVLAANVHQNAYFRAAPAKPEECSGIADDVERLRCRERVQERMGRRLPARIFSWLVLLGGVGITFNAVTGLMMVLQMPARRHQAVILLILGLAGPAVLLLLG